MVYPYPYNLPVVNPGTLTGYTQSGSGPYGTVPGEPDPGQTQRTAIGGNIGAMPDLATLANLFSQATSGAAAIPYQMNLPGYQNMLSAASGNTQALLAGQLPQDVLDQIYTAGAERGIMVGGAPGSPNINAATMRALGLNSLQAEQMGQQNFLGLMAATPKGQQLDLQSMMVTPAQQQLAQEWANYLAAMPNPYEAAMANLNALRSGMGSGYHPGMPVGGGYTNPLSTGTRSGVSSAPVQPAPGSSPWQYQPGAYEGSSVFGGLDPYLTGGVPIDIMDPSGGLAQPFGQMPDYSQPGPDPMSWMPIDQSYFSGGDPGMSSGDLTLDEFDFNNYWGW